MKDFPMREWREFTLTQNLLRIRLDARIVIVMKQMNRPLDYIIN